MAQQKKVEAEVTPRATPLEVGEPVEAPALSAMGTTFAERAKAMQSAGAENKAVGSSESKAPRKSTKN